MNFSNFRMLVDAAALLDKSPGSFIDSSFSECEPTLTTLAAEYSSLQPSNISEVHNETIVNGNDKTRTSLSACECKVLNAMNDTEKSFSAAFPENHGIDYTAHKESQTVNLRISLDWKRLESYQECTQTTLTAYQPSHEKYSEFQNQTFESIPVDNCTGILNNESLSKKLDHSWNSLSNAEMSTGECTKDFK
ncbi:uncharacterized protein LOC129725455 isoform X2 [Wyeomyia smithii]|uniref:uncharacterized protein LOC129725455 isoform X2 n=1 Tax=Wyeomyia smithii TaxID=174621 RepID=UPI0024680D26|nr:uncharacterized protein LOC129725455 isoform X2 [Wyeomyia smithii]